MTNSILVDQYGDFIFSLVKKSNRVNNIYNFPFFHLNNDHLSLHISVANNNIFISDLGDTFAELTFIGIQPNGKTLKKIKTILDRNQIELTDEEITMNIPLDQQEEFPIRLQKFLSSLVAIETWLAS